MKKTIFRVVAMIIAFPGLLLSMQPRVLLPRFLSYSGDFWISSYGQLTIGLHTLGGVMILSSALLAILSFTTIVDNRQCEQSDE